MISIDEAAVVADLVAMVQIPSVNPFGKEGGTVVGEAAMAEFYMEKLIKLGLEVDSSEISPGRRNVWGRLRGTGHGPTVLLSGHLDTVGIDGYDRPFDATIRDGRVYGLGSADMKAGLAAYLEVVRQLNASGERLKGDLIVAGVVDEEQSMQGSLAFGRNGPPADFAIIGEPTSLSVASAHKGQLNVVVRTFGKSAHSSVPENGDNAIMHMHAVLGSLSEYSDQLVKRPPHKRCGYPTFNAGVIRGGTIASSVPDLCELEIDRRTVPGETLESVLAELEGVLVGVKKSRPKLRYEICSPSFFVEPLNVPDDSPLLQAMLQGYAGALGTEVAPTSFPGSTDAPNLGCPAVICGPGALAQAHSLDEYVPISEVVQAAQIYHGAIRRMQNV